VSQLPADGVVESAVIGHNGIGGIGVPMSLSEVDQAIAEAWDMLGISSDFPSLAAGIVGLAVAAAVWLIFKRTPAKQ
jgi:hypothetical protein